MNRKHVFNDISAEVNLETDDITVFKNTSDTVGLTLSIEEFSELLFWYADNSEEFRKDFFK